MTPTTENIRQRDVLTVECDIPDGVTLAQYRAERGRANGARRGRGRIGLLGLVAEALRRRR